MNFYKISHQITQESLGNMKDSFSLSAQEVFEEIHKRLVYILGNEFYYYQDGQIMFKTLCVNSAFGYGNEYGSNKTPLGLHVIDEFIGDGVHPYQKFVERKPTEIITPVSYGEQKPGMYGRILTLDGVEKQNENTLQRRVYIHGNIHNWYWESSDLNRSKGCIGLKLDEMILIFNILKYYKQKIFVYIDEKKIIFLTILKK